MIADDKSKEFAIKCSCGERLNFYRQSRHTAKAQCKCGKDWIMESLFGVTQVREIKKDDP